MARTAFEKEIQTKLDKDEELAKSEELEDEELEELDDLYDPYDYSDREKRVEIARDIILRVMLYSDEMHISAFTPDGIRIMSINDIIRLLIENPNQITYIRDDDCGVELWSIDM